MSCGCNSCCGRNREGNFRRNENSDFLFNRRRCREAFELLEEISDAIDDFLEEEEEEEEHGCRCCRCGCGCNSNWGR